MLKKLLSLLTPSLLLFSLPTKAYEFERWQIHGTTFYGMTSDKVSRGIGAKFTDAFTSSKNAVYGVSFDFGRYYTNLNSDFVKRNNLGNFTLGAEFSYSYLNSDYEDTVVTDTTTYYQGKVEKSSIRFGAFARYYFYHVVFVRFAGGLDQTFSSETQRTNSEFAQQFYKIKNNILTPYNSLALGFDIGNVTSTLQATYIYGTKKQPSYYTLTINLGFNYNF
ncbi:hypothetical protein [Psittacicella gerlachiana]|uniref:Outer membrane protein beta-barrel domain-containing protein n=1 Tax=Psittacicella gerlachiana TaxID=2028574 RepID=A0A3A1YI60_9GAMM|nr:hypothetical protein [Psittacicella gerlachiana]RIY35707.1 hypothetical protein CKF59_03325 [Psittacicella gerlachiana]